MKLKENNKYRMSLGNSLFKTKDQNNNFNIFKKSISNFSGNHKNNNQQINLQTNCLATNKKRSFKLLNIKFLIYISKF